MKRKKKLEPFELTQISHIPHSKNLLMRAHLSLLTALRAQKPKFIHLTKYVSASGLAHRAGPQHKQRTTVEPQTSLLHSGMANEQAAGVATMDIQQDIMDKLDSQAGGKNARGGRKGRGGRGGGGGGGGNRSSDVSRALSRLLRHQAENAGIKLDGEGYAPLDKVLQWGPLASLGVTLADVQAVVATNEKQRFSLKPTTTNTTTPASPAAAPSTNPGDYLIRANQGHSIKLESSSPHHRRRRPAGGLSVMGRNHIHCAAGTPEEEGGGATVSGMRRDAQLLIEIDVARSMAAGVRWWRSDNAVILTEGDDNGLLSTEFFKSAREEGGEGEVQGGEDEGGGQTAVEVDMRNKRRIQASREMAFTLVNGWACIYSEITQKIQHLSYRHDSHLHRMDSPSSSPSLPVEEASWPNTLVDDDITALFITMSAMTRAHCNASSIKK
ncbi:tRNA 2'-phosphotransferase 1 [Beauveria bassiana D1-5]|uniref:2'-phosphotransferase n=1 Tax=Beauveria bassiana D1-5 TaxID=1245745 RepID=A0A0A2W2D0_BEABA|nr:tRNA 2'-phosphotransferase 1 [Beauveria bassiana D1-5]